MLRREALLALGAAAGLLRAQNAKALSNEDLTKLLEKKEDLFFLDVREPSEIAELGSVPGYVNIPVGQLETRLAEIPKNKNIVTACARGKRAAKAAEILEKAGYKVIGSCGLNEYKGKRVFPKKK